MRQLHVRAAEGDKGTDVTVDDVVMEDGVQCVALDEEAFTLAFGGSKGESQKAMSTETAAYMEVNIPRFIPLVNARNVKV